MVGSAAVAVVSSQWDEPYGLVSAEAMACGTPVAASPRGGLVEVGHPRSGALAASDTAEDLAQAMLAAAALPRAQVRAYAESALSIERLISDYERLYQQCLAGDPRRQPAADRRR